MLKKVYVGTACDEAADHALKEARILSKVMPIEQYLPLFYCDAAIRLQLKHPNILILFEHAIEADFLCEQTALSLTHQSDQLTHVTGIITEYCDGGDLSAHLDDLRERKQVLAQHQVRSLDALLAHVTHAARLGA